VRVGAFFVPRAIEPAVARPAATTPAIAPDPYAAAMENGGRPAAPRQKPRGPSLFERVTGVGRSRHPAAEPEHTHRPAPAAAQPQQQRLGALDPSDRLVGSKSEEDLLDIPAFLRRQAN
jgi:cell division protein FtsZ